MNDAMQSLGYGLLAVLFTAAILAVCAGIKKAAKNLLKGGRLSAGEICEHFSVTGASISRHLAILKDADLIRSKREGKFIYYELNTSVLEDVMLWITDLKGVSDYEGND